MSPATRHLYLARHGHASADETRLTDQGRRQAALLGERLRGVPLSAIHHGPLARAAETAQLVGEQLACVPVSTSSAAGDYCPYVPDRDEMPEESADETLSWLEGFTADERMTGPVLAREAVELFTGAVDGPQARHELVVTHNFLIAWLVREALGAPAWRWIGLNHANAALTVIRYAPRRPAELVVFNDLAHLPVELRWTGFEVERQL
ncbi:histidine phosphatase family protein [Kribbella sp. CA-253562]|uniref:histidine phosphatase family protein n=1 Tax=Kribbella sp. CA-253562 TaxID=3239942 RepID=UPI003D8D890B